MDDNDNKIHQGFILFADRVELEQTISKDFW